MILSPDWQWPVIHTGKGNPERMQTTLVKMLLRAAATERGTKHSFLPHLCC